MTLSPATRELLRWLDVASGAAHAWVDVDARPKVPGKLQATRTYAQQIQKLVDEGLGDYRKAQGGRRFMRITSLGRAEALQHEQAKAPTAQKDRTR